VKAHKSAFVSRLVWGKDSMHHIVTMRACMFAPFEVEKNLLRSRGHSRCGGFLLPTLNMDGGVMVVLMFDGHTLPLLDV